MLGRAHILMERMQFQLKRTYNILFHLTVVFSLGHVESSRFGKHIMLFDILGKHFHVFKLFIS